MAAIRPRKGPNGRQVWQAQIMRLGFKSQYRTFDTKGEAEAWARRVESEMDSGVWQDRSEGDRTTVREGLARYWAEIVPHLAESSRRAVTNRIKQMQQSSLAPVALSRVGGREVADHIRARERSGAAPNTIRLDLATLSHLFTVARGPWGMAYLTNPVPLARAAMPKLPPGRERRLQGDEEARLVAAASPEFGAVIRFALATGMRRGEIAALQWSQVDLKRRALVLSAARNKNRTARTVPLAPAALEVLRSIPRRLDGAVFGMSPNAIKLAWDRLIRKTGIQDLHFHDLRHEAISRLFENTDLDMMEIRAISGHKTLQMLARYTHLRTHRLADRLAGMGRTGAVSTS